MESLAASDISPLMTSILELTREIENLDEEPAVGEPRKVLWAKKRFPRQGIRCVGLSRAKRRKYIGATAKDFPWCILKKSPRATTIPIPTIINSQTTENFCREGSTETQEETDSSSSDHHVKTANNHFCVQKLETQSRCLKNIIVEDVMDGKNGEEHERCQKLETMPEVVVCDDSSTSVNSHRSSKTENFPKINKTTIPDKNEREVRTTVSDVVDKVSSQLVVMLKSSDRIDSDFLHEARSISQPTSNRTDENEYVKKTNMASSNLHLDEELQNIDQEESKQLCNQPKSSEAYVTQVVSAVSSQTSKSGIRKSHRKSKSRSHFGIRGKSETCTLRKQCFACGETEASRKRVADSNSLSSASLPKSEEWTKDKWNSFFCSFSAVAAEAHTLQLLGSDNLTANKRWLDCMRNILQEPPF